MTEIALQVALAVVRDSAGTVLVGRRDPQVHLGGMLEFPGGKIQTGETPTVAMARELREETGLVALEQRPLMSFSHRYPADETTPVRQIIFHVFIVSQWQAESALAASWCWLAVDTLDIQGFPAANCGILQALKLPEELMITADLQRPHQSVLSDCYRAIESGVRLICLRDPQLSDAEFQQLAAQLVPPLQARGCRVMVNCPANLPVVDQADGLHLTSKRLMATTHRPLGADRWCSAAGQNPQQLRHAATLGMDFVTLSPVQATLSHAGAEILGWEGFAALAALSPIPVYALGGVRRDHLPQVWRAGGQGVAGIRSFKDSKLPEVVAKESRR